MPTLANSRTLCSLDTIAVVGAGLVFALALLLSGMVSGFHNEIDRTVSSAGADAWLVPKGASGPFTSVHAVAQSTVSELDDRPGVTDASGLVISPQSVDLGSELRKVMMIGACRRSGSNVRKPMARMPSISTLALSR